MHYCFVCGEIGKGAFRFPQNQDNLSLWLQSLGIREMLPKEARICAGHFHPNEILVIKGGKRQIKKGPYHQTIFGESLPNLSIIMHQIQGMRMKFYFLGSYFSSWGWTLSPPNTIMIRVCIAFIVYLGLLFQLQNGKRYHKIFL